MITHNISGYNQSIVTSLQNPEPAPAFLNIQESHHLPSSKNIYDESGKYVTFHVSAVDEGIPNVKRTGGIITYIRSDISTNSYVFKKNSRYLITVTGKVVNINCYLPQPQLYQSGEYKSCLHDIREAIAALGESYAYIITGDVNCGTHNRRIFLNFVSELQLHDRTEHVPYTYIQNSRYGVVF